MVNHFIKNRLYSTIQGILRVLFISIVSFGIVFILIKYNQMRIKMEKDIIHLFVKSIEEDLNMKMGKVYSSIHLMNNPTVNGDILERSIISADTIITKKESARSHKEDMFNSFLTILRLENMLYTDTLNLIFQKNLKDNDIHVTSFVLLKYDDKTEISGDTTNYVISFRTPVNQRGFMDEITFQGLIHYTPLSIIKMIPRYLFINFISVVSFILFSLFYLSKKINAIQPDKIIKLRNGDYYIGLIYYNKEKKVLRSKSKTVNLTSLVATVFEFFLDSDDYTANKEELQNKFWQTSTSYNSMTSAVNKLRTFLNDVDSTFSITTAKGSDFYKLEYDDEED